MTKMPTIVDAFNVKKGPTESGTVPVTPLPVERIPDAVGGELIPFDLVSSLPLHILLLFVLMVPAFLLLYRKRDYVLNLVARLFF
jgi:hypothetical protein